MKNKFFKEVVLMKKLLILIITIVISFTAYGSTETKKIIEQIRKDYAVTNAEKNYKVKEFKSNIGNLVRYYTKNGETKKIVAIAIIYHGEAKSVVEYYLKNEKVYFILHSVYTLQGQNSLRFYYDSKGNLIRYTDDINGIIEDREKLKKYEPQSEWLLGLPSDIKNNEY